MIWIETITGIKVDLEHPTADMISSIDIGTALSNLCRFSGHVNQFYSVAQHSVEVAKQLPDDLKLFGLLHDAPEAYTSDIPSPVKKMLDEQLPWLEFCLQSAIDEKFKSNPTVDQIKIVEGVDQRMLITEAIAFRGKRFDDCLLDIEPFEIKIIPFSPDQARYIWMTTFTRLLSAPRS